MQTIKKNWVYLLFAFSVVFFVITFFTGKSKHDSRNIKVSLKTFHSDLGWGYDVYTNDSVYIHQEYMPAFAGRKSFATEKDAEKVGSLVLSKMKYTKMPQVTLEELDSLGIKP